MAIRPGFKRDGKTGRIVRKNRARMMSARKGARKRKGRHLSKATRLKLSRSIRKTKRTGKTKSGRRVIRVRRKGRRP